MKQLLAEEELRHPAVPSGLQHYNPYCFGSTRTIQSIPRGYYASYVFTRLKDGDMDYGDGRFVLFENGSATYNGEVVLHTDGSATQNLCYPSGLETEVHYIPLPLSQERIFKIKRKIWNKYFRCCRALGIDVGINYQYC